MKKNYLIILFLIFYAGTLGYKLIFSPMPFYDWDESLYVQTGKEMLERRFFLFPVWQGSAWLDKPPLVPLLYGVVMKGFFFIAPEISTRLFTLCIALVVLTLSYTLYRRVVRDVFVGALATILTAFTPIFLQRAQVVNLDVFLVLGWLGYIVYFGRFWLSTLFLLVAILSKSLLGFYPIAIVGFFHLFLLLTKKINAKQFKITAVKLGIQTGIAASWFLITLVIYKEPFLRQHIIESHFKRVSSSIEFHFGKRTYYLDLLAEQFGVFTWLAVIGLVLVLVQWRKKQVEGLRLLYSLYLLPWFVFLNLTKTKIFWYLYPVIPQFAFLSMASLQFLKKNKPIYYFVGLLALSYILYLNLLKNNYLQKQYSSFEPHYHLAQHAKKNCDRLYILENAQTREAFATLSNLGLLITTTKWWGSHPSIVYYFGKPVQFLYDADEMMSSVTSLRKNECVGTDREDIRYVLSSSVKLRRLAAFGSYLLFEND